MHRNRRHVLAVALAALLVLSMVGCTETTPTPEPITVSFACLEYESAYYEPLAEAYHNAHPNVTIELLPRRGDALQNMGAGDADVFTLQGGLQARQEQGDLLSLDAWFTGDETFAKDDFFPGTLALYVRDGKTWAIPISLDVAVLYYNRDLFDERGVAYPRPGWTWDDFLNTGINLSDASLGIYGYAAGASPEEAILFVIEHGGRIVDDWQNPTRATLNDPRTIEALAWYADLIYEYGVSPTQEDARRLYNGGQYAIYAGVVGGRIGMWTEMFSSRGGQSWGHAWEFHWGMANLPREAQSATLAQVQALAISSQARHPEECWRWIDYVSRQVPEHLVPVRQSVAESAAFEQLVGADAAAVARSALQSAVLVPPDLPEQYMSLGEAWAEAVQAVLNGDLSAAEALDLAQQKVGP